MSTIAAISTGQAAGGIGIVRISGEDAILVADRIFRSVSGKKLCDRAGYTALYGTVYYEDKPLDEAVALVFRAPKSYTGEDVCEISCHGGLYITRQILRAALSAGAIPAEAGEFTKRAFLNGKMDLTGAEAVMQMISAHGEQAGAAAFSAMEGALSRKTAEISEILLDASASLAAWVDYPDEEIEDLSDESLLAAIRKAHTMVQDLLNGFDGGRAVTEGIPAAIIGRPNTGKSTLMNMLSGTEKSIVTAIPGTTRDIVEETVLCGNVTLRLADTAGLRETQDTVESIGVERAKKKVSAAEFVFAVFDSSLPFTEEDKEIASLCRNKKAIAVINKTDLAENARR